MVLLSVHPKLSRSDQGFTLTEILIALVIAGVLSAILLPNLIGLISGNRVKSAQDQVQSALRDAQRNAIRRSKSCEIILDKNATPPEIKIDDTTANEGCLADAKIELPDSVKIATNISGATPTIKYSFKGHTTLSDSGTIVIYPEDWKEGRSARCIVISPTLGIMRSGAYSGNPTNTISSDNCKTSTSTL